VCGIDEECLRTRVVLCECLVEGSSGGRYKQVSACSHQIPRTTHCTIPRTHNYTTRGGIGLFALARSRYHRIVDASSKQLATSLYSQSVPCSMTSAVACLHRPLVRGSFGAPPLPGMTLRPLIMSNILLCCPGNCSYAS
jgi:hypothetical protein